MAKVLVIGAANLDIIGLSNERLLANDSNPGKVTLSVGGVAKNIAENLKRLQCDVEFMTFFGNDSFHEFIESDLTNLNIKHDLSITMPYPSGIFMALHQPMGELALALNDFELLSHLEVKDFIPIEDKIETFDYLVFDTNLPEHILTYLANRFEHKKIIVDGVSQSKVKRIKPILNKLYLVKVNQMELASLTESNADDIILTVRKLLPSGPKHIIVTHRENPITYNIDKSVYQTFIYETRHKVSSIGCGDALLSGTLFGLLQDKSLHDAINLGKKAASLTMEVATACHPDMNPETLQNY